MVDIISRGNNEEFSSNNNETIVNKMDMVNIDVSLIRGNVTAFETQSLNRLIIREAGHDIPNWQPGPSKKGVDVFYSPVKDSEWYTIKSRTIAKVRMETALEILRDPIQIPEFDEMTGQVDILEHLGSDTQVRLVSAKSVMFTSARDFCVATTVQKHQDGRYLIATRSVDHPDGRNRKGYVRATSLISGYIVAPVDGTENECEVTVLAHMDLGGYIPGAVMKYLGLSAPIKLLLKFREIAEK